MRLGIEVEGFFVRGSRAGAESLGGCDGGMLAGDDRWSMRVRNATAREKCRDWE